MIPAAVLWRSFQVWRAWRAGGSVPLSVTYFVNGACNLRCRGCFFFEHPPHPEDAGQLRAELDSREALELVDQVADMGVPFLELVGGEPFLRQDLIAIGERARQRGLWTTVTTNGTRFTPELADRARRTFRGIFVSLDGDVTDHDRVRGAGNHERTMQGIRMLLASKGKATIGVTAVLSPENVDYLPEFAVRLRTMGVQQFVATHGLEPAPTPTVAEARRGIEGLRALRRADPAFFPQDETYLDALLAFYGERTRYGCHVEQKLHVSVTPQGETSGCCMWPLPLGPADGGRLRASLEAAGADRFEAAADCPGCARHDYGATLRLFEKSLPGLVLNGLELAFGGVIGGARVLPADGDPLGAVGQG